MRNPVTPRGVFWEASESDRSFFNPTASKVIMSEDDGSRGIESLKLDQQSLEAIIEGVAVKLKRTVLMASEENTAVLHRRCAPERAQVSTYSINLLVSLPLSTCMGVKLDSGK